MTEKWYAVYTKPRWEKKVADVLTDKKVTCYCPLNKVFRQWSDRKKVVQEPLFTSYVFVHVTEKQLTELRKINGILHIVYWLGKPAVIRDSEIKTIRQFLNEYSNVKLEKVQVRVSDTVRILNGSFLEQEGTVVAIRNNRVKVALPSLGYILHAEFESSSVAKTSSEISSRGQV